MTSKRPTKDEYYLKIALDVARRGTCLRRNYGAVIVNNDQIISTGYCGAPRGTPNCVDLGKCYRNERNITSGKNYELCRSVHGEANAIIHAGRQEMMGGTIYIAGFDYETGKQVDSNPCKMCRRMILNAGIKIVVVSTDNKAVKQDVNEWIKKANEDPFYDLDR